MLHAIPGPIFTAIVQLSRHCSNQHQLQNPSWICGEHLELTHQLQQGQDLPVFNFGRPSWEAFQLFHSPVWGFELFFSRGLVGKLASTWKRERENDFFVLVGVLLRPRENCKRGKSNPGPFWNLPATSKKQRAKKKDDDNSMIQLQRSSRLRLHQSRPSHRNCKEPQHLFLSVFFDWFFSSNTK